MADHFLGDGIAEIGIGNRIAVLRGDDHGIHAHRAAIAILHSDLRLAVGPEKVNDSLACELRERRCISLCASVIGIGISSSVSSQANPNISP